MKALSRKVKIKLQKISYRILPASWSRGPSSSRGREARTSGPSEAEEREAVVLGRLESRESMVRWRQEDVWKSQIVLSLYFLSLSHNNVGFRIPR